jgi:hypothetical protein
VDEATITGYETDLGTADVELESAKTVRDTASGKVDTE